MQEKPICWGCDNEIDHSPVYAAPCDHERCPSAVFHGLCLMEWREHREQAIAAARRFFNEMRGGED